jgi:hypothetical protein
MAVVTTVSEASDEHVDGLGHRNRRADAVVLPPGGLGGAVAPVDVAKAFVEAAGGGVVYADANGQPVIAEQTGSVFARASPRFPAP